MTPIPLKSPQELHPALKRLSEQTDLVGFQAYLGRVTKHGDKPGPEPWTYTRKYISKHALCSPDEAIALFQEAGADNDIEALFHVAVSLHLIP
jgi:hypothetical protein